MDLIQTQREFIESKIGERPGLWTVKGMLCDQRSFSFLVLLPCLPKPSAGRDNLLTSESLAQAHCPAGTHRCCLLDTACRGFPRPDPGNNNKTLCWHQLQSLHYRKCHRHLGPAHPGNRSQPGCLHRQKWVVSTWRNYVFLCVTMTSMTSWLHVCVCSWVCNCGLSVLCVCLCVTVCEFICAMCCWIHVCNYHLWL